MAARRDLQKGTLWDLRRVPTRDLTMAMPMARQTGFAKAASMGIAKALQSVKTTDQPKDDLKGRHWAPQMAARRDLQKGTLWDLRRVPMRDLSMVLPMACQMGFAKAVSMGIAKASQKECLKVPATVQKMDTLLVHTKESAMDCQLGFWTALWWANQKVRMTVLPMFLTVSVLVATDQKMVGL
jgi:ribosomal protein S9